MMLILDDHPLVRQGLCSLIQMKMGEKEILEAGTLRESKRKMEEHPVNTVFVDLNLGKENGFDFLVWLKERGMPVKIFVLTSSSRRSDFVHARELGVDAYLLKDAFVDEIMYSLQIVASGGKFYSAALMEGLAEEFKEEQIMFSLTQREAEVLELLREGCSNARIGSRLFISESTVKKHISSILGKLNLKNRVEAVIFANKNSSLIRQLQTGSASGKGGWSS